MSRVRLAVTVQPVSLHQRARHLPRPLQRTATQMEASPAPPPPQPIPPPRPPRPPQTRTRTRTRTPAPPAAAAVPRAALTTSHQRRGKRNRALSSLDQWTESICDSQGN